MLIGVQKTARFFYRKGKLRGSVCFLGGMLLVLMGWTVIGMLIEIFGIFNLFGNFFPVVMITLKSLPVIGPILRSPVIDQFLSKIASFGTILPVSSKANQH